MVDPDRGGVVAWLHDRQVLLPGGEVPSWGVTHTMAGAMRAARVGLVDGRAEILEGRFGFDSCAGYQRHQQPVRRACHVGDRVSWTGR